jgi:hypothetical protein
MRALIRLVDPCGVVVAESDLGAPGTPAFDQLCEWSARYACTAPDLLPVLAIDGAPSRAGRVAGPTTGEFPAI